MRRADLDRSIRLLLNACAAAALLGLPACAKESGSEAGGEDYVDDGCGGGWEQPVDVDLEVAGTTVSLTRRGGQVLALLREGTLLPVDDYGNSTIETIPATGLRAWTELSNGDRLVVGDDGQILRSASGSLEWMAVDVESTDDLLDVVATAADMGALAISSDRVLYTSDGGLTWTELEPGSWTGLRRLFVLEQQIWLIGDGGQVWTTGDPTSGWQAVALATSDDLLDGAEGCSGCVTIISANAVFVRDGGDWVSVPRPEGEVFTAVADGYVTTDRALYLVVPSQAGLSEVRSLDFTPSVVLADGEEVFVAGSGGELVRITRWSCLGRPWVIDGAARTATLVGCEAPDGWARDGLHEHASVASFARFVGELLALAAPPALILAAQAAIVDELEHARLCFELAAREHGPVRPGPLPLDRRTTARAGDPVALALAVFEEGCVGETVAAAEAAVAADEAVDADARRTLARIAADERRHAALAWQTLRWLVDTFGEPVRAALRRRLPTLAGGGSELRARVIAELVRPLARELSSTPLTHAVVRC